MPSAGERGLVSVSPEGPLRIVVADDQASVREGLVLLLGGLPGIEVVGVAADGEQALDLVAQHQPGSSPRPGPGTGPPPSATRTATI
jgi:PleD family two-component response regulator